MIKLKRAYNPAEPGDGFRILVERLWPRGITKEESGLDAWLKEIAPSTELRKWYSHDLERWPEFQNRYRQELEQNPAAVQKLKGYLDAHPVVTFIYAAKDEQHNSAVVLKQFVEAS